MPPELAVVIPTRDRPNLLLDCLRSLAAQDFDDLEVLVVDDGSDPPLAPIVSEVSAAFRCHRQAPAGLNVARNVGAELTTAPIIAYLDDDTIVPRGWARAVTTAFRETGCSGLGGRIGLDLPIEAPKWLTHKRRRYLGELELGDVRRPLDGVPVPVGANCAVRRDELERLGGFHRGLDRNGKSLISSGDTEFFRRLRAEGGSLVYDPAAFVIHRVAAERVTLGWFRRRAFAQGATDELLEVMSTTRSARVRLAREYVRSGRAAPILARALLARRGTANARLWLEYCRGRRAAIGSPEAAIALTSAGAVDASSAR